MPRDLKLFVVDTGPLITLAAARSLVARDRARVVELSTLDFLNMLEAERRIQSADQVFTLAADAGRVASRVEKLADHDVATREALQELVRRREPPSSRPDRT